MATTNATPTATPPVATTTTTRSGSTEHRASGVAAALAFGPTRPDGRISVSIAGSSGSIGTQTLEVIRAEPERFVVECLGVFGSAKFIYFQF